MTHEHHHDHDHDHDCSCGCGREHTHEHHHHEHGCSCGCGHDHDHEHPYGRVPVTADAESIEISGREKAILQTILAVGCLPVARLIATKSDEEEVVIDCLSPVYLYETSDTLDEVKEIGALLRRLSDLGLLTLDYDRPIADFDYSLYTESDLFAYFVRTIDEARGREGFLCDTAEMELGSMAVTPLGHEVCCRG